MYSRYVITEWAGNSRKGWDKVLRTLFLGNLRLLQQGTLGWRLVPKKCLQEGRVARKLSKTTEKTALVKESGKKSWSGLTPT